MKYWIDSWSKHLQFAEGLSQNTVISYLSDLNQLSLFLQDYLGKAITLQDFKDLTKNDIRSWILFRRKKGETARTITRGLSAIKNFAKFLIDNKVLENTDLVELSHPKISKLLPRPLSISQINDIITSVSDFKQTDWIVKRDKAIITLIYSVGLRISEALNLNRSDFLRSQNSLSILGKGGKYRYVPLIPVAKNVIDEYLDASPYRDAEALFVNKQGDRLSASAFQKLIRKIRNILQLSDHVTPHALRHSCATHLMEYSGELREIQELLGHSSITSTQIYADVAKKYISEVYNKCHPLANHKNKENNS